MDNIIQGVFFDTERNLIVIAHNAIILNKKTIKKQYSLLR